MSNKTHLLGLPWIATLWRETSRPAGRTRGAAVSEEEALVQAYTSAVWQTYSGMSVGGWGWPW
jgi:hypothetical protein